MRRETVRYVARVKDKFLPAYDPSESGNKESPTHRLPPHTTSKSMVVERL